MYHSTQNCMSYRMVYYTTTCSQKNFAYKCHEHIWSVLKNGILHRNRRNSPCLLLLFPGLQYINRESLKFCTRYNFLIIGLLGRTKAKKGFGSSDSKIFTKNHRGDQRKIFRKFFCCVFAFLSCAE